jgi:hypothetical protein
MKMSENYERNDEYTENVQENMYFKMNMSRFSKYHF